jgi:hypothetical protein
MLRKERADKERRGRQLKNRERRGVEQTIGFEAIRQLKGTECGPGLCTAHAVDGAAGEAAAGKLDLRLQPGFDRTHVVGHGGLVRRELGRELNHGRGEDDDWRRVRLRVERDRGSKGEQPEESVEKTSLHEAAAVRA